MLSEQFIRIVEKEQNEHLVPFLQSLSAEQKKQLVPLIKKLSIEYLKSHPTQNGNTITFHQKGTSAQANILQISSFVCMNRADFDKTEFPVRILEEKLLRIIVDWYCPPWFSDFVNEQASREFIPPWLTYDWIMEINGKGHLQPSKDLVAKLLVQTIFGYDGLTYTYSYHPESLLKRNITLEEHIWYLFEVETNLHFSDRFLRFNDNVSKEEIGWIGLLKKYSAENRIDRFRLLKESLHASNRNFNKVLSGWFSQLFTELEPTKEEALGLQKEIFGVLNSPHSKPVNTSLNQIKKIVTEKEFDTDSFLDSVPVLLSSDTKNTVSATMLILEKLAQKHGHYREKIVLLTCQVFIYPDEELQSKAAKILAKYAGPDDAVLKQEISVFYPTMFTTAKQLLSSFYAPGANTENTVVTETKTSTIENISGAPPKIPVIETIDDLVFLASQAFDNNEPWHIDLLPAALLQFRSFLKTENIPRFEPAFQRAFGLIKNPFRSTIGRLDHLLAIFFIDFGNWLIRNFSVGAESIETIYKKHDQEVDGKKASWRASPAIGSYTAGWESGHNVAFYHPYKQLLLATLEKIQKGSDLPVLSTPTHAPGWIFPGILIHRLRVYQQTGQAPDEIDLQVAISRCFLDKPEEALQQASQQLSGEFRELMGFLLDDTATPRKPFHFKAAWMVASLTKKEKKAWPEFESFSYYKKSLKNYTGELVWQTVEEEYTISNYDYKANKRVPEVKLRKILRAYRDNTEAGSSSLKKIFSIVLPAAKDDPPMLYEFLNYKLQFLSVEYNDIKRILSLTPNNPEPILADTINKCLQHSKFWEEGDKKMVIAVLQVLHEIWNNPGQMSHLFLGTCMLSSDKTVANIAGEIWLKAVTMNKIDNAQLGKMIGLHESIEFAPLKRFTDLVTQNLFRLSTLHNRELQTLVENVLVELPDEPIMNLKKLMEIYGELIAINNAVVQGDRVVERLKIWEKNMGLKKMVTVILTNITA